MSVLRSRFNKVTRQKPLTLLKQAFNIFLLFSRVSSLYKTCGAFLYSLSKPVTYRSSKKQFLRKRSRNEAQEKFLLEKFQAQKKLPRCGKLPKFYALAWVRLKLCGNCAETFSQNFLYRKLGQITAFYVAFAILDCFISLIKCLNLYFAS